MNKWTALAICGVAAALAASPGCGGGGSGNGDKTYEGDDYSFTYPGEWDEQQPEPSSERRPICGSWSVQTRQTQWLLSRTPFLSLSLRETSTGKKMTLRERREGFMRDLTDDLPRGRRG